MNKRRFILTQDEVNELQGMYHNSSDAKTQVRFQAVRLYGQGYRVSNILSICGISRTSLMEWCQCYRRAGVAGLLDHRNGGNSAKLKPEQIEWVQSVLHQYTPAQLWPQGEYGGDGAFWTVADLVHLLQERLGVVYQSDNSYRNLFESCHFSRQRPGSSYKSRSEQAVVAFEEVLEKN
jgi:transposase